MYRSLLVPLDRSPFAEQALPLALGIARRANARLDLVAVHASYALKDPHACWAPFDHALDARWKQDEQRYLNATADRVTSVAPAAVTTDVLPGSDALPELVAEHLLERVRVRQTDLIVMATHARKPTDRFTLGSVADELIRRADVPVLLVRPGGPTPETIPGPVLDNILIPLDGSPLAEQVLGPALDLARLMQARCHLLRVVPPASSAHQGAGGQSEKADAQAYLRRVAEGLQGQGLEVRTEVITARHAPAAEVILGAAEGLEINLIALATHGTGGVKRLLVGSVADKLVRLAECPVLVYRPTGRRTGHGGAGS